MTKFILECWDSKKNKYIKRGQWGDEKMARTMFDKPYWRMVTRRLIKIEDTIVAQSKGVVNPWRRNRGANKASASPTDTLDSH